MRIIPVMDILQNRVVHARGGKRENYQPLESKICRSTDPLAVTRAYRSFFSFRELYIADLDAITNDKPNLDILKEVSETSDMNVMVDAGVSSLEKAKLVLDSGASKVVIGTETLEDMDDLLLILEELGRNRVVVSIDCMHRRTVSGCRELVGLRPWVMARMMMSFGVEELILLELSRVGSRRGLDVDMVSRTVQGLTMPLIVGGGVRNMRDIRILKGWGADGVLVATALHNSNIKREDLIVFNQMPNMYKRK